MNSEIFAEWFKKDFVPAVKSHQRSQNIRSPKALLLIDNCSAHPDELSSRDGSVTCLFLPPMFSLLYTFCLPFYLINIHVFDYPDSRLSGLFTEVPTSPDNRGSTVHYLEYFKRHY